MAGLGNMDCGKDMQIYILTTTWFTPWALAIIEKISSLLRLPGNSLLLGWCYVIMLQHSDMLGYHTEFDIFKHVTLN